MTIFTTVDCLHSSKSNCPFSQVCIRNILHYCALNDLQIRAMHIEEKNNRLSDCLSWWDLDKKFHKLTEGVHTYEGETNFVQNLCIKDEEPATGL